LAVAIALALTLPAFAADAKGKVKTVSGPKNQFVMTDANRKEWTIRMNEDGKVFINDKESKVSDLQAGDMVTITYSAQGERLFATKVDCKRK
jgi:biopolymer transport protein ExbD